jgi:hypothetical protein
MTNSLLQIKIKQRLNKLASFDYDNIQCWQIQEAFNKAQLDWVRRQIYGINSRKEGMEQSTGLVDDLRILLTDASLKKINNKKEYAECEIPENYLYYSRVDAYAMTDCCPKRRMTVYEVEEANISVILNSKNIAPNFEWSETVATFLGKNLRVYSNESFNITDVTLVYYRLPRPIQIKGCVNIDDGIAFLQDQTCEFKDDIAEILTMEAASILAGDIESQMQYQRSQSEIQKES